MVTGMGNLASLVKMIPGAAPGFDVCALAPSVSPTLLPCGLASTPRARLNLQRAPAHVLCHVPPAPLFGRRLLTRSLAPCSRPPPPPPPPLPGMNKINEKQISEVERKYAVYESMINSMTKQEREQPELLAKSPSRRSGWRAVCAHRKGSQQRGHLPL